MPQFLSFNSFTTPTPFSFHLNILELVLAAVYLVADLDAIWAALAVASNCFVRGCGWLRGECGERQWQTKREGFSLWGSPVWSYIYAPTIVIIMDGVCDRSLHNEFSVTCYHSAELLDSESLRGKYGTACNADLRSAWFSKPFGYHCWRVEKGKQWTWWKRLKLYRRKTCLWRN